MVKRLGSAVVAASLLTVAGFVRVAEGDSPPINALRRYEPRLYDVSYTVTIQTQAATGDAARYGLFQFDEAPIVMPVIFMGQYSKVFVNTDQGFVFVNEHRVPPEKLAMSREKDKPYNTHLLRMVVPQVTPQMMARSVRWGVSFRTQTWSADIDENLAQRTAWPRDRAWPDHVKDGLAAQWGIESDNPIFRTMVQAAYGDHLLTETPYRLAKKIVADTINNFQINGEGVNRGLYGLHGLNMRGALAVVTTPDRVKRWIGTEHDLVCVCIALLRAAGIPARPVIGLEEILTGTGDKTTFVSWGEFYLPNSGWVAFDPNAIRGKGGSQYSNLANKWEFFGRLDDLNRRVVLAYHFIPPATVETPRNPALWGWDPRPQKQPSYDQTISFTITKRGRGEDDPG